MALHAARPLSSSSSTSSATAPLKLSAIFRDPRPRPRKTHLSSLFLGRKPDRPPRPGSDDQAPPRRPRPRPRPRQPWEEEEEEEAGALPKPRPRPTHLSSQFLGRKPDRPGSGDEAPPRRPRQPWEEEAGALLRRLHEGRYLPGPDPSSAPRTVSPSVVKAAAERFGHDNQVVAKWLSGSDLKKLALFGCPTVERRTVFASKRLRAFFNIQEDKICGSCKLKSSCKFANQEVPRHNKVILSDTMRIISLLVLDACPKEVQVTAELKASICKQIVEATLDVSVTITSQAISAVKFTPISRTQVSEERRQSISRTYPSIWDKHQDSC